MIGASFWLAEWSTLEDRNHTAAEAKTYVPMYCTYVGVVCIVCLLCICIT